MSEDTPKAEVPEKMGIGLPFASELKLVQEVIALFQLLRTLDSTNSGVPDYADLLKIGMLIIATVKDFRSEVANIKTGDIVAETQAFNAKVTGYFNQAEKILAADWKAIEEKFPDLVKAPEIKAAIANSTVA